MNRPTLIVAGLALNLLYGVSCGLADSQGTNTAAIGSPGGAGSAVPVNTGGGGSVGSGQPRICDGSTGLRFMAAITGGESPDRPWLFYENGLSFLIVSGECRYFVWTADESPLKQYSPVRQGELSEAEELELSEASAYISWRSWAGQAFVDPSNLIGGSTMVFFNGVDRFSCGSPCAGSNPRASAAMQYVHPLLPRLYQRGLDVGGPIRLRVLEQMDGPAPSLGIIDWPLSTTLPLAKLAIQANQEPVYWGPANLVTDANDLSVLRALRSSLVTPNSPVTVQARHPTPGFVYIFAYRDVVPFENEKGFIPGMFAGY